MRAKASLSWRNTVIAVRDLTRQFVTPAGKFQALSGVTLEVRAGEFMAIVGRSGSGKSTLLNLMAGLDRPTSGTVSIGGNSIHQLSNDHLARWRGRTVGVVFQFFQLLPTLTVAENVMLPMDFAGTHPGGMRRARALELLSRVGVSDQADKLPAALSGGQQQRVAIARALANDPPLILADEPTGNLDSATSAAIFGLFRDLVEAGKTMVVVTHEREAVSGVGRTLTLADGCVAS
ncbi:MAG: ABC transporter ATP-binding protein [Candidatus Eisenbacteria bacterium]|uniref:ABC transporter ATP-binding protein n=1 Tax=Eiseniibacteriota bacterium TaxID=2212470 RepID=A0A849SKT1_UNCEI|nr:ABC transporter ATP-binding protein [Candidatus Eisenbacteria bacterium]